MKYYRIIFVIIMACVQGCVATMQPSLAPDRHLARPAPTADAIPALVRKLPEPVRPRPQPTTKTYSVVVNQLPVHNLLFALGRDAQINVDIHPAISGEVTLNAVRQTLEQILERIAAQVDIRWTLVNGTLSVVPDTPFLRSYRIDYFNLARSLKTHTGIANSVASTGSTGAGSNSSSADIATTSQHDFWKTLEKNLRDILQDEDKLVTRRITEEDGRQNNHSKSGKTAKQQDAENAAEDKADINQSTTRKNESTLKEGREANNVIINTETGVIMVRANQKKHARVSEFLAHVSAAAQRQVMIEATIVEVMLSDQYQAGIDWSRMAGSGHWSAAQSLTGPAFASGSPLGFVSFDDGTFSATLRVLEQFGRTRVLSSPRIMALNNQTAVMKVVDEQVYFQLSIEEDKNEAGVITNRTYTSELHTVPVGLVMQVTPQIAESGQITLNVRPTITNISSYTEDPAVAIVAASGDLGVRSLVPNLQVREFDSTLKVPSGQIAMLGGLIQDKQVNQRNGLPGLSRLPLLGDLFSYRDDTVRKIELVVFLKPVSLSGSGLHGELAGLRPHLPGQDFFASPADHAVSAWRSGNIPQPGTEGERTQ